MLFVYNKLNLLAWIGKWFVVCGVALVGLVALDVDQIEGGVLIMWDRRVLEKLEDMVGTFSVSVWWQGVEDGFLWACLGVYGPNDDNEKVTCGMSLLVFNNIEVYRGATLGTSTLYVF